LLKRANALVGTAVNLVIFTTGLPLRFLINRYHPNERETLSIVHQFSDLGKRCNAFGLDSLGVAWQLVAKEIRLFQALEDLTAAAIDNDLIAINCARVVEALRQLSAPGIENRGEQWKQFRNLLNIDLSYLKFITENSKGPRHGNKMNVSPEVNDQILSRTWGVMNRFIAFRMKGNTRLPLSEFPLLQ